MDEAMKSRRGFLLGALAAPVALAVGGLRARVRQTEVRDRGHREFLRRRQKPGKGPPWRA